MGPASSSPISTAQAADETVQLVQTAGGEAIAVSGDVALEADVKRLVEEGVQAFKALHILYNNAGVLWKDRDRSVLETDDTHWERVIAINLKSVFWVTKYGIPHLQRAGGGSIILVGSVSALAGFTRAQDAYTAAKGGADLAQQVARHPVRQGQHPLKHHPSRDRRYAVASALSHRSASQRIRDRHPARSHRRTRARSPPSPSSWPPTSLPT